MPEDKIFSFYYGQKGIIPLALVFFDGLYKFFCTIEGKKGIYLSTSADLVSFEDTNLFLDVSAVGGASAFVKNDKIYFFFSDKRGVIRSASLDRTGNIIEYPLPMVNKKGLFDPKVFYDSNKFFLLCCSLKGTVFLYESENLFDFIYFNSCQVPNNSSLCCPSMQKIGDEWVLIYEEKGWIYFHKAHIDLTNKEFFLKEEKELLDKVSSPRIATLLDGRTIMACISHKSLVFREIWTKDGSIFLFPLSEMEARKVIKDNFEVNDTKKAQVELFETKNISVELKLSSMSKNKTLICFSENTTYPEYLWINTEEKNLVLSTGKQKAEISRREYYEETPELVIFFINDVIEVYFKKIGLVISSSNPYQSSQKAKIKILSEKQMSSKIAFFSL